MSVPKNMLADLKDSVRQGRSLNLQDKYGATAVSLYEAAIAPPPLTTHPQSQAEPHIHVHVHAGKSVPP